MDWWHKQAEVAESLLKHKRVFVKASHSVGKSFLAGGLVNWFFDCFNPGICITTAPNAPQVRDILWKEVRIQRPADLHGVLQPRAPRMESSPNHFAVGYTSRDGSGFQGRHEENVLIVFDECVGVTGEFWDAAEGMMTGENNYFLAICNPTDTGSRAYSECLNREKWHVIEISALDHPNIAADLEDRPAPYPKAVRLTWIKGKLKEWCTRVPTRPPSPDDQHLTANHPRVGDIEFPPHSDRWYRPGPLFESRVLGRWPTQGACSVWSEAMWDAALVPQPVDPGHPLVLGCDVARFGDDFTSIVARRGACVLHHESHNGWTTAQTAGRLKQLAQQYSAPDADARKVEIYVDDDGVGGGVVDQNDDYDFLAVKGGDRAIAPESYPNKRSELWFTTADRASDSRLDLSRLSPESLQLIQRQIMAPTWKLDSQGRRVVEPKAETKRRIGRSPDDADALNLAFATVPRLYVDHDLYRQLWRIPNDEYYPDWVHLGPDWAG